MNDYFKELDTAIYQGSFRVTDNDGGSATLALNIYSGNGTRLMIDSIKVSLPNTSAGRTIYVRVFDSDDDELQRFAFVGMDNNSIFLPSTGREANNANNITNKGLYTSVNPKRIMDNHFDIKETLKKTSNKIEEVYER